MILFSPDTLFIAGLLLKMVMTAAIVVIASIAVERSGPFIGALITALPTAAGAAYIILAIEHPADFVAASAVGSIAANAIGAIFALSYAILAQRHGVVASIGGAMIIWFAGALLLQAIVWTPWRAVLFSIVIFAVAILAGARFQTEGTRRRATATGKDIALRALTVALCVVIVTTASDKIGSLASGVFAVFPVAMASFFMILHPRVGGRAASAVAAHVPAPLFGLGLGFLAVHFLAPVTGVWWSYAVGLGVGITWNAMLWGLRNRATRQSS